MISQRIRQILLVSLLSGFFAFAFSASAAEIYVDAGASNGGNGTVNAPFNSFAKALTAFVPGQENIFYATGNFQEGVLLDSRYSGTSDTTRTIIDAWPGKSLPVNDVTNGDLNGKPVYQVFHPLNASFISIKNQIVRGSLATNIWFENSPDGEAIGNDTSGSAGKGICFYNSARGKILNNVSYNNSMAGILIPLSNADDVLVEGNTVHHNGEAGIQSHDLTDNLVIRNNTTYANNYKLLQNGGGITMDALGTAIGVVIEGNTVTDEVKGINVGNRAGVTIRNNTVERTSGDAIYVRLSSDVVLDHNTVRSSAMRGVVLEMNTVALFDGNTLSDNILGGVSVRQTSNATIQNSVLVSNGPFALSFTDSDNAIVRNNTIVNNNQGVQIMGATILNPHVDIVNTIFFGNTTVYFTPITIQSVNFYLDNNAFSGYSTFLSRGLKTFSKKQLCKKHNLECDSLDGIEPNFIDPVNRDFHLRFNSPLVGQGDASRAPFTDIDGDLRTSHAKVDIGADEVMVFPPSPRQSDALLQ